MNEWISVDSPGSIHWSGTLQTSAPRLSSTRILGSLVNMQILTLWVWRKAAEIRHG